MEQMEKTVAVVMAAGQGKRMNSDLPKVLIEVCGRPMIDYVLEALHAAGLKEVIVIVGHRAELVRAHLADRPGVRFAVQSQQLGTGHAVMACREHLADHQGAVFIVAGDSPLMQAESVARLIEEFHRRRPACLLGTAHKDDPTGLGRILRDAAGRFAGIVEEKDADPAQRAIREVNLSYYVFDRQALFEALEEIRPDNQQGEYYLTDCPAVLLARGRPVEALPILKPVEALSVNTPQELAAAAAAMQAVRQ